MSQSNQLLYFGYGNAKLHRGIITFSLPAGHTCPGALECLCKADKTTGKLEDDPMMKYRCFAAAEEAIYKSTRISRHRNFELLKAAQAEGGIRAMRYLILQSLLPGHYVRIHVSGDFYSDQYFQAWMQVCRARPEVKFYAYTKSIDLWVGHWLEIPENLILVASYGGKHDDLIKRLNLKSAIVVLHPDEADAQGLQIDHNDDLALMPGEDSFALLIHGNQKKGSAARQAIKQLKEEDVKFAYGSPAED